MRLALCVHRAEPATVPEEDIRRIRGGAWDFGVSTMSAGSIDEVMHSSDQFDDLGFRLANLTEPSTSVPEVPALPRSQLPAMLLGVSLAGGLALHLRQRSSEA